jgi:hypothetical protein
MKPQIIQAVGYARSAAVIPAEARPRARMMSTRTGPWLALLVACLSVWLLPSQALGQPNEGRRTIQRARGLALAGQCQEAVLEYDRAIQLAPSQPELLRERGNCKDKLSQRAAAVADYRAYCSAAPAAPDVAAVQQRIAELETAPSAQPATVEPAGAPPTVPLSAILQPASDESLRAAAQHRRAEREEKPRQPVAYAQRDLTDPALTLTPDLGFTATHVANFGGLITTSTIDSLFVSLSFSPTDHFALRAVVAPVELAPVVHYGTATLSNPYASLGPGGGGTYWFGGPDVEGGLSFDFAVSTLGGISGASFYPAIPLLIHAGSAVRIDSGIGFAIATLSLTEPGVSVPSSTVAQLRIPLQITGNIVDPVFIGVRTGFEMIVSSGGGASSIQAPLGFVIGASIPGPRGPLLDIVPFVTFPFFLNGSGSPTVEGADYDIGIDLVGHIYL